VKRKPDERQAQAMLALLSAPSIAAAARRAKVGERTLRRWLRDPGFSAELAQRRSDALSQGVALLAEVFAASVEKLHRIATGKGAREDAQAAAARAIVTSALKASETAEIMGRLDALERLLSGPDPAATDRSERGGWTDARYAQAPAVAWPVALAIVGGGP
jgi:hypothetical protein